MVKNPSDKKSSTTKQHSVIKTQMQSLAVQQPTTNYINHHQKNKLSNTSDSQKLRAEKVTGHSRVLSGDETLRG